MDIFWQKLIEFLGGFTIFAAAIAWLIKSLTAHFFSKDIEAYKSRLTFESAQEIERFKAQLTITAKEHETRFNKLHEKRIEALSELYYLLEDARLHVKTFAFQLEHKASDSTDTDLEQSAKDALEKCIEPNSFFRKHRLYFSKSLSEKIDKLLYALHDPSSTYLNNSRLLGSPVDVSEITKRWQDQSANIDRTMQILEDEFRAMLGSCNPNSMALYKASAPSEISTE